MAAMGEAPRNPLVDLALIFLKLGAISFGGPVAHIALMREEFVTRRRWMTDEEFLDLIGATNLIPGPNSTEMAIHIGRLRAGVPGLIVAGACFILPAAAIVLALAIAYVRVGSLPETRALFYGLTPVVVVIVAVALMRLAESAVRSLWQFALGVVALVAAVLGMHELTLLAACGAAGMATRTALSKTGATGNGALPAAIATALPVAVAPAAAAAVSAPTLFAVFLKAGALLFGSGYVLLAFLRADLVERLHWLTEAQLLDAIAVGQFTPGPVFTTATFVGYVLDGSRGAALATAAIFLPAFVYVAVSGPIIARLRRSVVAAGALDGANIAALALMTATAVQLGRVALVDLTTIALALGSVVAILRWRVNSMWLLMAGALVGFVAR